MRALFRSFILASLFTVFGYGTQAFAQDGASSQFGVLYGFSVPDSDNTNPRQFYGAKGSAFINPRFSVGGYYLLSSNEEGSGGRIFDYSLHGLEAAFHIPTAKGDTFIAFRTGLSKVRTEPEDDIEVIFSPYHYGIAAGYDYLLFSWLTIGFEGHFMTVQKSNTLKDDERYSEESFGIIGFLVALQFRL